MRLRSALPPRGVALAALFLLGDASRQASADALTPPWTDSGDVPPPPWARSVAPRSGERGALSDFQLFAGPSRASGLRGVTAPGASLPFFGAKRGPGCSGRFWLVGPLAWTCSDDGELAPSEPSAPLVAATPDGLPAPFYFVRGDGAEAFVSLDSAEAGSPDRELEGGWAVAIVEQRTSPDDPQTRWGHTSHGLWIAMRDLAPARPSRFQGELVANGRLGFAWVVAERASVWSAPTPKAKPTGQRPRFTRVTPQEESGDMVRIEDDAWMLRRDVATPNFSAPPAEVAGSVERWIDVELATQTLVAYEGVRPVFATLVSSGRGAPGTGSATPPGVSRVWVKLVASTMDNMERDEDSAHYSLEDVPYVQFFRGAVALHGTYWHGDFGHTRSHGCVNLSPLDARWLFDFTAPRLPSAWVAAYPTTFDEGTLVRVR